MNRFNNNMILYRSVGMQELELIYDSGMKAFPARLPQQPIFYPVLDLEYARQVALDWNTKREQMAGYVTLFKVEDEYINKFEEHSVGDSQYEEFWIPAEELDEFNSHITGTIKVVEAFFGDAFQGFVPEKFGMQGKNAVEQFTLLANDYIYKRLDFYLEIKRNHKAVFLNYPFWLDYEFKNPGLKEKVLKAIKEGWLTSFPQTPLMNPIQEDISSKKQVDPNSAVSSIEDELIPIDQASSQFSDEVIEAETTPIAPDRQPLAALEHSDNGPVQRQPPNLPIHLISANIQEHKPSEPQSPVATVQHESAPTRQPNLHFEQGIQLGLNGNFHAAIEELSRAVEEDPQHIVAYTSLGVAFHRTEEDDRALSCYEAALQIDPRHAEAHYFAANILYNYGNVREAITGYTIAIGLEPELIDAHQKPTPEDRLTDYTATVAEIHRIAKVAYRILDLTKSLEAHPKQANLLKERASEYSRLWNYEQAIADCSSYLKIQPDDAGALHLRGLAYEQIGQQDRAVQDYQRATVVDPQYSDEFINRGITHGKAGNFRQSIDSLTEAIRLAPQQNEAYFNRGISYFQLGDVDRAIDDFSAAIQRSPTNEDAYYWRGICNEEAGHQREAIEDYKMFLSISQNPGAREEIEQRLSQLNQGN